MLTLNYESTAVLLKHSENITRRGSIYVSRPCAQGAAFFFIYYTLVPASPYPVFYR